MAARFTVTLINGQEVVEEADNFQLAMGAAVFSRESVLAGGEAHLKIYGPGGYISVAKHPEYGQGLAEALVMPETD